MDQYEHTDEAWPEIVAEDEDGDEEPAPGSGIVKRFASASEILSIPDIETRDVWVPEWNTHVQVRALSSFERDTILDSSRVGKGRKERLTLTGIEAKYVIAAAMTPEGKPLFQRSQLQQLTKKNAGAVSRIYKVIAEMSGLSEDAEETARGNSSPGRNGASPSG